MRRPRNLIAWISAGLHFALCALFLAAYFTSPDSERGMVLFLVLFIDPWLLPFYSGFSGSHQDEITIAFLVIVFGSVFWWGLGWLFGKIVAQIRGKKEEPSVPTRGNGT